MKNYFRTDELLLTSVPSFAQHIGVESSIQQDASERTCPCYPGEDWTS